MARIPGRNIVKKNAANGGRRPRDSFRRSPKGKAQAQKLKIAKGLDLLLEVDGLTLSEQTVLKRVKDTLTGIRTGNLSSADLQNMRKIAKKYRLNIQ